jgi:hypothetical protein
VGLADRYDALPLVEVRLIGDGGTAEFRLPHRLILAGSETVLRDGAPLDPLADYRLDYTNGLLFILTGPPRTGTVLRVTYRYLPLDSPPEGDAPRNLFELPGDYVGSGDRIEVSGSKGVGLRLVSGQGLGVVQSLDVALSGELASGLRLEGVLSDEDLPVSVEGTSAELEELDEVRLSAWTDHLRLDLGDYRMQGGDPVVERYGPGERRLEGAQLRLDYEGWGLWGSVSRAKGRAAANRFNPTPGVSGPYQLRGENGETNVVLVAGSEEVYLNGVRLSRGLGADYTVDYSLGTLTFNPALGLYASDEVLVRFSYSSLGYRRDFYGGRFRLGLGSGDLFLAYYHEGDDPEADLWGLSDADRDMLSLAGDREVSRPLSGPDAFEYVGDGNGDHDLVYDPDTGQYSFEPSPGGAYRRRVWTIPAPSRHRLAVLGGDLLRWEDFRLGGELALSDYDLNLFSERDDDDNAALAGHGELDWRLPLGGDTLSLTLGGERREPAFRALTAAEDDPELHRRWGYDPEGSHLREGVSGGVSYGFGWGPELSVSGSGLWLTGEPERREAAEPGLGRPEGWWRRLWELGVGAAWPEPVGLEYSYRRQGGRASSEPPTNLEPGDPFPSEVVVGARVHDGRIGPDFGWLRPRASVFTEDRTGSPDYARRQLGGGFTLLPSTFVTLDYDLGWGRELGTLGEGRPALAGWLDHLARLTWRGADWRLLVRYRHEDAFDRREGESDPGASDAGRLEASLSPWSGALAVDASYELTRRWSYPLVEQFVYAPDGEGSYRREPDPDDPDGWIYIFDPGDPEAYYDRELLPAGEPVRATGVSGGLSIGFAPWRIIEEDWARLFELELEARAADEGEGGSILDRALFADLLGAGTLNGSASARARLTLFPTASGGRLKIAYSWREGRDRRIIPRDERYGARELDLSGQLNPLAWLRLWGGGSLVWEWRRGSLSYFGAGDADRDVDRWRAWFEPRFVLGAWRPRVRAAREVSEQTAYAGSSVLASWEVTPGLALRIGGLGDLDLSYRWRINDLTGPPTTESLVYRRPGTDHLWRVSLRVSIKHYAAITLSYTGEAEPGRETVHRGEISAKVFF